MSDFRDIEALVAAHQKISAIKEFRARTGVGLFEAKNAVEHFEAHGRWPDEHARGAQASAVPLAAVSPPSRPDRPLRLLEDLLAQGQIIGAIKELRTFTGWGLKESKDAVDEFRERGRWPGSLVALVEQSAVPPTPVAPLAPAPAPTPASAPALQASVSASLRKALTEHLGHAPEVHLVVVAHRSSREGYLVMLRDRACFVHTDRRLGVDPVIAYDAAHHVEVGYGSPAVLFVSVGHVHERFELAQADAEAALALFRVFSP